MCRRGTVRNTLQGGDSDSDPAVIVVYHLEKYNRWLVSQVEVASTFTLHSADLAAAAPQTHSHVNVSNNLSYVEPAAPQPLQQNLSLKFCPHH